MLVLQIYRAEILLKAGVHPNTRANTLTRAQFDAVRWPAHPAESPCDALTCQVWFHTVSLLRRGYESGSILTVDPDDVRRDPSLRRYIYNRSNLFLRSEQLKTYQEQNS